MQVSVETVNDIERRVTIVVPASQMNSAVAKKLQEAARSVRIDGFRPGKVPMKVVKQRFGAGIHHEVVDETMRQSFFDAVTKEGLNPVGPPQIEPKTMELGEDLEYTATFEVYPEIVLKNIADIKVDKLIGSVEESDIDDMIEVLQKQRTKMTEVDRAAQLEDQVILDFKGTLGGEMLDGGSAENADLVLGSNNMIPGFEAGIVGMKAGDEKDLSLSFPDDYPAEHLAGKEVEFNVNIKKVNTPITPELDEEFYKEFGVKEGGKDQFIADVRKNMERELEHASKNKIKAQLFDAIAKMHDVMVPKVVIDQEINQLKQEMMQQYGGNNQQQFDLDKIPGDMFKEEAQKRASIGLLVGQCIKDNKIEIDEAKLKASIDDMASSYDDPEEVINYINNDEKRLASIRAVTLEEQVVEHLLNTVQVHEVQSSYSDIVKPAAPKESKNDVAETVSDEPSDTDASAD